MRFHHTMLETTISSGAVESSPNSAGKPTPKKKAAATKKVGKTQKPVHPPTSQMVNSAIASLKERSGSSLQAIKKYIAANYKVEAESLAPFIRKYLKSAVAAGTLTQTKGAGASGSFKLKGPGEPKSTAPTLKKQSAATKVKAVKKPAREQSVKETPKKKATTMTVVKSKKTKTPPTKAKAPKVKRVNVTTAKKSPTKKPATTTPNKKVPARKAPKKK